MVATTDIGESSGRCDRSVQGNGDPLGDPKARPAPPRPSPEPFIVEIMLFDS